MEEKKTLHNLFEASIIKACKDTAKQSNFGTKKRKTP